MSTTDVKFVFETEIVAAGVAELGDENEISRVCDGVVVD